MKRGKYITWHKKVKIPSWALCYLINSDDSGLDPEDKKTVDDWVEKMREGGRMDVCCPNEGEEAYFSNWPAFGLPCDVEDCDVLVDRSPKYERCDYPCCGQSRFEPHKREALDGMVWWRIYDNGQYSPDGSNWIPGFRCKTRKECVLHIWQEMVHGRLPFEPDDDRHDMEWLKKEGLACGNSR